MNAANISTEFSIQSEILDDKFLRICIFLEFGLGAVVELACDNLPNSCTNDFSMRLSAQCLLHRSVVDTNLIYIDRARIFVNL